jgi:hypothetical protein
MFKYQKRLLVSRVAHPAAVMTQDERAISFVVMATPDDMRANAEYIRMADEVRGRCDQQSTHTALRGLTRKHLVEREAWAVVPMVGACCMSGVDQTEWLVC